jgi:adenosylhomocysteine nucleosidase
LNAAGVVAALAAEARTLGPTPGRGARLARGGEGYAMLSGGMLLVVSGIGQAAAAAAAGRLIDAGAGALVSWGVAGGLVPSLEAGAVCLPEEVIGPDGTRYPTASEWRETLSPLVAAHRPVACGSLLTSAMPIATAAAKAAAHQDTGAVAVDMESSAVAKAARTHGLPFIAVRAIVDTAADEVPRAVSGASQSGQVRIGRLVLGLMRSPADLVPLLRLAKRYRAAIGSLRAVAALLEGPSAISMGAISMGAISMGATSMDATSMGTTPAGPTFPRAGSRPT